MCADRSHRSPAFLRRPWAAALLTLAMACVTTPVRAHNDGLSEASALSALPVAVSVSAPVMSVAAGSVLTLMAIDVVADGTVWVLQRASDGARIVVKWSALSVGMASVAVGTAITVTAVSAGWVLSTAGEVLALIPNALGQALLHHERVIR
ncbi:MAG: hypothetical protein EKK47_17085 [Burkholderiales bacterium]|jgi:hypothetical protein|nr:MAG: hypothetical protein EKK47_17085 [Burkholderiales bacterium]